MIYFERGAGEGKPEVELEHHNEDLRDHYESQKKKKCKNKIWKVESEAE